MKPVYLEHVNLTVKDPDELAALFCRLFDWKIRWAGEALNNGRTVHVGSDELYWPFTPTRCDGNQNT